MYEILNNAPETEDEKGTDRQTVFYKAHRSGQNNTIVFRKKKKMRTMRQTRRCRKRLPIRTKINNFMDEETNRVEGDDRTPDAI